MSQGEYLTAADVATELGIHEQTAQAYFRQGLIPGRKIGRSWRTTRAALDAFVTGAAPDPRGPGGPLELETKG